MQRKLSIPSGLSIFLVLSLIIPMTVMSAVAPSIPAYGTAVVDGVPSEWDVSGISSPDFFAHMYRAGNPNSDNLSDLYLRYECLPGGQTARLYALVQVAGVATEINTGDPEDHFIKAYPANKASYKIIAAEWPNPNDGMPPDFFWVPPSGMPVLGWEASSIEVPVSTYTIEAHTQAYDKDGSQTSATGDIPLTISCRQIEVGDAPDSNNHFGVPMKLHPDDGYYYEGNDAFGNFPTVAYWNETNGSTSQAMCHLENPLGLVLGDSVSYEQDADLMPDEDGWTNLDPVLDISNRDSDDGLVFPPYWIDGIPTTITYTVSAPAGAADYTRYVNIWIDWNRDGDWNDTDVQCVNGTRDERVLVNDPVNVPDDLVAGETLTRAVEVIPCNPVLNDRAWVRITLSEGIVAEGNDGSGPGTCFAEGETEDWLYDPTYDFGDAPDGNNNLGMSMTAYPGVPANYPTTISPLIAGDLPGPCHIQQAGITPFLGPDVSYENTDADLPADADPLFNIMPEDNNPNNDRHDDGIPEDLVLPHCPLQLVEVPFSVTVPQATGDLYVNMWFDWNRDGDWGDPTSHESDVVLCGEDSVYEWAVQNVVIPEGRVGLYKGTVTITSYREPNAPAGLWNRVTLTQKPVATDGDVKPDGSGSDYCFLGGETEDYYQTNAPTAVGLDLVSLVAEYGPDGVVVKWETQGEFNLRGFHILRAESEDGLKTQINQQLIQAKQAPGSMEVTAYEFPDGTAAAGATYLYWLQAVDKNGDTEEFGPVPVIGTPFYPSGPQGAPYRVFLPLIRQ